MRAEPHYLHLAILEAQRGPSRHFHVFAPTTGGDRTLPLGATRSEVIARASGRPTAAYIHSKT